MNKLGFLASNDATIEKSTPVNKLLVPVEYTHSCAIGQTGCGKTTSYIYPNLNERIKNQHAILLFDYKGKEHAALKAIAKRNYRLNDVVEIGVPWGVKINLIKYMNEAEIRELTISIMGLSEKDPYWSATGSNIIVALWKVIKGYRSILEAAEAIDLKKHFEDALTSFEYPLDLTFRSFSEITRTQEKLTNFATKLPKLITKFTQIVDNELKIAFNENNKEDVLKEFEELTINLMNFIKTAENDTKALSIFEEVQKATNSSTTIQTIILSMSTTFGTISELDAFNEDSTDLIEALNNYKIVVINTKELHEGLLSSFVNSLFNELSKRIVQPKIAPVSIFIDEAQRVMNKSTDIHIDVLREAKVDIFLAFQNIQLMIEALGENKFSALLQNLTNRYLFKNILKFKDFETDKLKSFEYYNEENKEKYKAEALFLTKEELFHAQREYFILHDAYEILNIQEHSQKGILLFNSHLFNQKQIQIQYEDGFIEIVKIKDVHLEKKALSYMHRVYKSFIKEEKTDEIDQFLHNGLTMEETYNALRIIKKQSRANKIKEYYESKISS